MLNLALLAMSLGGVAADTCQKIAGNYYCDETKLVQFHNVGFNGEYNRVTAFNNDGTCSFAPQSFSGSLSPFDEELSIHFRGPIQLEQFKVFTKGGNQKRETHDLHHRHAEPEPVIVTATNYYTEYVTAGADDAAPTLTTSVWTGAPENANNAPPAPSTTTSSVPVYNYNFNHEDETSQAGPSVITTSQAPAPSTTSSVPAPPPSSGSGWSEIASYNAAAGSADGLVFLNNLGGGGSGVFDFAYGNSLSYAGSDGVSCAPAPEVLAQTTVGSNKEFAIFSSDKCEGDSCGFYRPGNVAYHGFGGAYKVFLFEFSMPNENAFGFNADMPAVWMLNAQIPRNLQYGNPSCSCWSTGCGELDLWEVLNTGNNRLTTTLHDKQNGGGGGTANYFQRPTQGTLKGAVVFDGTTISVLEIPEIPDSIDDGTIQWWISQAGAPSNVSL